MYRDLLMLVAINYHSSSLAHYGYQSYFGGSHDISACLTLGTCIISRKVPGGSGRATGRTENRHESDSFVLLVFLSSFCKRKRD